METCKCCESAAIGECGNCGTTCYCSVVCQREHWHLAHAQECIPLGADATLSAQRPYRLVVYKTEVGASARSGSESDASFGRQVEATLNDARGWRRHGYAFMRLATNVAWQSAERYAPVLRLRLVLVSAEEAASACTIPGFSCWIASDESAHAGTIAINYANWMGGSASRLPLARYRNYVVNHEVGHALGLKHAECPLAACQRLGLAHCPASVMQQMTRGPEHVAPCVESEWPWAPEAGLAEPTLR